MLTHRQLAGGRVGIAVGRAQDHALDAEVAKLGAAARWQAIVRRVAEILDVSLRGQRRDPLADGAFAAEPRLALKGLSELIGGVAVPGSSLVEQDLQDDVMNALFVGEAKRFLLVLRGC